LAVVVALALLLYKFMHADADFTMLRHSKIPAKAFTASAVPPPPPLHPPKLVSSSCERRAR
jgi:hypothetical protein